MTKLDTRDSFLIISVARKHNYTVTALCDHFWNRWEWITIAK
jgi:hypothetical protein